MKKCPVCKVREIDLEFDMCGACGAAFDRRRK